MLQGAPSESEAFSPIYHGDDASGLKWGVASVQGRRPHMEDMYQAEGLGGPAASGPHSAGQAADAARLGLTHFFAVFDGAHAPASTLTRSPHTRPDPRALDLAPPASHTFAPIVAPTFARTRARRQACGGMGA